MGKNRILFLVGGALAVLLAAAIAMFNVRPSVESVPEAGPEQQEEVPAGEGEMSVKVYFPDGTRLRMETRKRSILWDLITKEALARCSNPMDTGRSQ
ncbi:MAG: hypothetical protein ACWGN7_05660 [Thermodesulfovibrionales bacterium]